MESGRTGRPRPYSVHRLALALGLTGKAAEEFRRTSRYVPVAMPWRLPPAIGHFAGRAVELAALDVLRDAASAPVAIIGGAGVGKTALALHWAHERAGWLPDGQPGLADHRQRTRLRSGQGLAARRPWPSGTGHQPVQAHQPGRARGCPAALPGRPARPGRFGCHELLRAFAIDRLEAEEDPQAKDGAIRRLPAWYLRTADNAARVINSRRRPASLDCPLPEVRPLSFPACEPALDWLDTERGNLTAAVSIAAWLLNNLSAA